MPRPIQTGSVQVSPEDDYLRRQSVEVGYFNPDAFGAMTEQAWSFNPLPATSRREELAEAMYGNEALGVFQEDGAFPLPWLRGSEPDSPYVSAEEANERGGELGLNFDGPIPERALQIMIERKERERYRQHVLSRRRQGLGTAAGDLFFGFAIGAVDPLNVASAFIPIVGQARFAAMAGRVGTTGARLARGGMEGAVGAAVVEPLVYGSARFEQADYTLNDSLLNVAFGTVLGGGLHAGFGALGDALSLTSPKTRETSLRAAVSQAVQGRDINVEPIVRADPAFTDPAHPLYPRIKREAERVQRAERRAQEARAEVERADAEAQRLRNDVDQTTADRDALVRSRAASGPELVERHLDSVTGQRLAEITAELDSPATPRLRRVELEREMGMLKSGVEAEMPLARGRADAEIKALEAERSRARKRLEDAEAGKANARAALERASNQAAKASRRYREALEAGKSPEQIASERIAEADRNRAEQARRIDQIAEQDTARIEGRHPVDPEIAAAKARQERLASEETIEGLQDQIEDLDSALDQLVAEGELEPGALGERITAERAEAEIDLWTRAAKAASVCLLRG